MEFDLAKYKKVHIVGIKGVGAAALAEILLNSGYEISGSDVKEDFITTSSALKNAKIPIFGFGEIDFSDIDAVIRSVAYNEENNIDIKSAKAAGLPIFTYPEVVSGFFNGVFGVAVAGSHGKTTTTAMLADILHKAGLNVSAIVGSRVNEWGSGAKAGDLKKSDAVFALEADEYKEAFLNYRPKGAIITNIDYDHPDFYKNKDEYKNSFLKFAQSIPESGFLVANKDDRDLFEITKNLKCKVIFFGKEDLNKFNLKIPGEHNLMNANAAYLAAIELGVKKDEAKKYLEGFKGTARRFEILCHKDKAVIIDDYAHHPSEVRATLRGAREIFPKKKIVAVFQPHTYSRTKMFFYEFIEALKLADEVVLTDVYASARESFDASVSMREISEKIGERSFFVKDKKDLPEHCRKYLNEDVALIFMGAGDIWQSAREICA
ncbi:UDP-N-acetylmuramate--L-alanine ligase [Candidatus Azambacteria bacterium]|nr:UDP-N-acetylmuramate--L-alanine ligase [Candidatus Azambacteria bacterium]